jgi:hexulose-6-phosphate isomerase
MPGRLTRRQFVGAAGTLAAAFVSGHTVRAPLNAAEVTFRGRIRKAVKYHMVQDDTLSVMQKFSLVKELGFDGIEIRTVDPLDPHEVKAASEAVGLPIHGVINSSNPDIRTAIDRSKFWGGSTVLVVAGRVNEQNSYDANWSEWLGRLREAAPYAAAQNIRVLVENVWNNFLLSPLEMARFIDEIGHDAVGVYFDIGNVVRYGWPEQWIRILAHRIGKLDVKEYSRAREAAEGTRKGFQVEIGEGDCGWERVREALDDIGFSGWATAEVPGGGRERLQDIARRMDRVLALA